jgi:hypothetical protein
MRGELAAGWLDTTQPFAKGRIPAALHDKLAWSCVNAKVAQTRGFHECTLCPPASPGSYGTHFVQVGDRKFLLGSAEIRITSGALLYAAPTLVLHYVVDHDYLPPPEFVDGLLRLPDENALTAWELRRGQYW